jgi:hypothetical protein
MNPILLALQAEMLACYARIEGMKAENAHRQTCGNSIAYGEDAFLAEAASLQHIAVALRNSQ